MSADVSKGKDTTSQENAVEEKQQSEDLPNEINNIAFFNLVDRVDKLEFYMEKILNVIDIEDEAVKVPPKKNNNPDYLPKTGGKPVSIEDLPPRTG